MSIYTTLQANAEGGHTLIHKEESFDVNTKFERLGLEMIQSAFKFK